MTERVRRAVELVDRGIAALAAADADRLQQLAEEARHAEWPSTAEGWQTVRGRAETLGRLLILTERNLRILGRSSAVSGMRRDQWL